MCKLSKGIYTEVKKEKRNVWWDKGWTYSINGLVVARIYKQLYPGKTSKLIYRYSLEGLTLIPSHWKSVPKGKLGIVSDHYPSKRECTKAIKKALKVYIKTLNKLVA